LYTASDDRTPLADHHRHQLETESGIAREVIAERGYRTVKSRADLLEFKKYQRRAPSLYVPMHSPCGRMLPQIRPDTPRKNKAGESIKYETPKDAEPVIDVHPRNRAALKDNTRRLWITEGVKKGDSLTSAGEVAISLAGVWMFGTKDGLYPAWDQVALEDRDLIFVYDSDIMHKPGVAAALDRGSRLLAERGATVSIVYLEDGPNDEKTGVDDYLANGGTVPEMVAKAVPYDPANFEYLRTERNVTLKNALAYYWRAHSDMPVRTQGQNTRRSVMRAAIRRCAKYGKIRKDGLSFPAPTRSLAIEARVSQKTASRALSALIEEGLARLEREAQGTQPARYVLLYRGARATDSYIGEGGQEGESLKWEKASFCSPSYPSESLTRGGVDAVPELRWSVPSRKPTKKQIRANRTGNSKAPLPEPREAILRWGKKRAAMLEHALDAGGSCEIPELMRRFAGERTRKRDFIRRQLVPMTDPAAIHISGDGSRVTISEDWREALENAREQGKEHADNKEQEDDIKRQRIAYRADIRPDMAPTEVEMQAERKKRAPDYFREREEAQADPVSHLAAAMHNHLSQTPGNAAETPSWVANYLWAVGIIPERVSVAEAKAAMDELGGIAYRRARLEQYREASAPPPPRRVREASPEPEGDPSEDHSLDCECMDCSFVPRRYATVRAGGG
jgi:hypothetical protein